MVTIRVKNAIVPYKITLLSNTEPIPMDSAEVLVPYKITLLSNVVHAIMIHQKVLVPYKITLLSNFIGGEFYGIRF